MTMEQLYDRAAEVVGRASGLDSFTLVLPGWGRGNTTRLAGRSGPRGEIISHVGEDAPGKREQLVAFKGSEVLAWMRKNDLVPEGKK